MTSEDQARLVEDFNRLHPKDSRLRRTNGVVVVTDGPAYVEAGVAVVRVRDQRVAVPLWELTPEAGYEEAGAGVKRERSVPVPTRAEAEALISTIQIIEDHAHRIGMTRAAQALNHAKNETGWELADLLSVERND